MSLWTLRIGIALIFVGLALLSQLGDFLPVGLWPSLKSLLKSGSMPADPVFYRVVPGEQNKAVEFVLIGVGLALACVSLYVRRRK